MVKFETTKKDAKLIHLIAKRAIDEGIYAPRNLMEADMDITAVHCNGNPLRLEELLGADKFNFDHDIYGIRNHIDRKTGKLLFCFVPRYSKPERKRA